MSKLDTSFTFIFYDRTTSELSFYQNHRHCVLTKYNNSLHNCNLLLIFKPIKKSNLDSKVILYLVDAVGYME